MNEQTPEQPETEVSPDLGITPFRVLATEAHEIYTELNAVGFPESATVQIIAHLVADAVFSRLGYGEVVTYEIEDDEDDDDDHDGAY